MKKMLWMLLLGLVSWQLPAQTLTQTIRGKVIDSEAKYPLIGVTVILQNNDPDKLIGTTTDENGEFRLSNVPVGRQTVKFSYIGYKDATLSNLILTSAKELILDVSLEEAAFSLNDIVVTATRTGEAQNEMAMVSARAFSVDETDRYAGSRGDPARMASNFAGVQGADDSRNDIVVRGNSPGGVLWQVEGINIPNPNHFNIAGTAGGPVSIINNKVLANSDFYTGAFPAEFGNSIAGVFDLKFRNGNNENYEFSAMLGFLGTELFAEGPIDKEKKSSFIVNYRYSTLGLFGGLGINVGTNALPQYQDASFKLNYPTKNNGNISIFGVGGKSDIAIKISEETQEDLNLYGENDRDQYFGSMMGVVGLTYSKVLKGNTFMKATVAASNESVYADHYYIIGSFNPDGTRDVQDLPQILGYSFGQNKYSQVLSFYKKVNSRNTLTYGFNNDLYQFNFLDSARNVNQVVNDRSTPWTTRWNSGGKMAYLVQPYVQWKHKFSDDISMVAGVHSQYFTLNNSLSAIEPRLGFNWRLPNNQGLSFGLGVHSQIQPTYTYFYEFTDVNSPERGFTNHNRDMGFTRSNHVVLGYDKVLGRTMRMKVETYYQYLTDIPVEERISSFSFANTGAGFSRIFPETRLVNEGIGENYGVEFTLEKFYSKGYMFLFTASLFDAKYQGSDGIWRDTEFNGNYALNALGTKEFKIGQSSLLGIGTNVTTAGGRRYGPADTQLSLERQEVIYDDALRNTLQFRPYFRADLRINYRINRPKVSHELAFDLINLFGTKNILNLTWAPNDLENPDPLLSIVENYQLGFFPLFYYKIDF